jgi:hypothetical protein
MVKGQGTQKKSNLIQLKLCKNSVAIAQTFIATNPVLGGGGFCVPKKLLFSPPDENVFSPGDETVYTVSEQTIAFLSVSGRDRCRNDAFTFYGV